MTNKEQNELAPAFPPQVMQDNFGRMVVAVPGLSKLEYISTMFMAQLLTLEKPLRIDGKPSTVAQASITLAKNLLTEIDKQQENEKVLHITE